METDQTTTGEPVEVWTGPEAQEGRLKKMASPPRILHLATHGCFLGEADKYPIARVSLAGANRGLSSVSGADGEDGLLFESEAETLNLDGTELVVLSACETAKGRVSYTEGMGGLARALRIAGAKNVLVTLMTYGRAISCWPFIQTGSNSRRVKPSIFMSHLG